jgi:hypothetical protein
MEDIHENARHYDRFSIGKYDRHSMVAWFGDASPLVTEVAHFRSNGNPVAKRSRYQRLQPGQLDRVR